MVEFNETKVDYSKPRSEKPDDIVVYGLYDSKAQVEAAVDQLKFENFRSSDISVLMPDTMSSQNFAHTKDTKAPEGTATGATTGAVLGGALGWLVGIGALAIPGMGPFIAAGPIMAALAGVGVGGTIGAISGALVGMGIPEYEAKRFEGFIKDGGILLSVHCDDHSWKVKAQDLLERTGAHDVAATTEVHAIPGQVRENRTIGNTPRPDRV